MLAAANHFLDSVLEMKSTGFLGIFTLNLSCKSVSNIIHNGISVLFLLHGIRSYGAIAMRHFLLFIRVHRCNIGFSTYLIEFGGYGEGGE